MDKNVLKKFAIESRQELMEKVANKINRYFVDEEFNVNQNGEVYVLVNDKHTLRLTKSEYENRQLLVKRIKEITLEQVIEEAAYTWFNRIIAIRYMEIHDYLPLTKDNQSLGVRVLSSKDNTPDPEIMKIANLINPDLDIEFNKEYYGTIQDNNKRFEYVLLLVCKKLGKVIPQVFDGITDYIDILVPDNLLNESGYITKLLNDVSIENFEKVEIIGWLYQYYNQVEKDRVISAKKTYKKNEIAYATQLFTPDWVVKYMVENSLGKYWIEHSENSQIANEWKYFVDKSNEKKECEDPKKITFIDPCCGSGHILVYAFELFYQMYLQVGYNKTDIPEFILKNNLYGLDIDDRAGQLSILSILLKAREFDKNIFNKEVVKNLNIMSIQESNIISRNLLDNINDNKLKEQANYLINKFENAKEIGSLLSLNSNNYEELERTIENDETIFGIELREKILPLIKIANILSKKYNIVVTNPPYMNTTSMSNNLKKYVTENYTDYKYDLFSAFIIRNSELSKSDGLMGFMTPYVWMFISSYEKLRNYIIENLNISSLIQFEYSALEEATVPICSFVLNKNLKENGNYFRLTDYKGGMAVQEKRFLEINKAKDKDFYNTAVTDFKKIPGSPIVYWASERYFDIFKNSTILKVDGDTRQGMATSDNNRFLRYWFEVDNRKLGFNKKNAEDARESNKKWFPYNKGGYFRKWYGNMDYVINYENDGFEVKEYAKSLYNSVTRTIKSISEYFKPSISWSKISSGSIAFRYYPCGFIFDVAGCCIFYNYEKTMFYQNAFLNTCVASSILGMISPTLNYEAGHIAILPIIKDESSIDKIIEIVKKNISISKEDWDSFETSWDFIEHPLLKNRAIEISDNIYNKQQLANIFNTWNKETLSRFEILKKNEEELNEIFINIYGLQNELTPEVKDNEISIRKADKEREIKSLISYAVGCMFGRYSLDEDGVIYAGGEFNKDKYKSFEVDIDNIIPLTEENYFGDDIVSRFKKFIEIVYGKETLYENLDFIAEILGKRSGENSEETIRRYFINDFYNDHVKMYQKRPIYWLFDSGKKNGFKCLIYMHRYNEGLVSKIRLDYLHRMQNTYEKELKEISDKLNDDVDLTSKRELSKKQADISAKLQETNEYDEKIAHIADQKIKIDLDDGVVVNYAKFSVKNPKTGKDESILAKIK